MVIRDAVAIRKAAMMEYSRFFFGLVDQYTRRGLRYNGSNTHDRHSHTNVLSLPVKGSQEVNS